MDLLHDGPRDSPLTLVLAHGAGAPMDSPFMNEIASGLAAAGIHVVRFEFPYMSARRRTHRRAAPDREAVLRAAWHEVIEELGGAARLVIGGKSMGGRIASLIADEAGAAGLVCLGYPFHPPGRPQQPRIEHLRQLRTPALIVQGTRDGLGSRAEVAGYQLSTRIRIAWLEDGDHSFKPPKRSPRTLEQNLAEAVELATDFVRHLRELRK
ncbi:MAG TPA: alpha/beta fold hydrolase [Terriglobales bacterium]|jgi:predicted alpha/beta-hydrolase family hydrolase|nr:alpha/beta fold hydrolase [Terriglobales bacterium]